jgi:hypothetical protein
MSLPDRSELDLKLMIAVVMDVMPYNLAGRTFRKKSALSYPEDGGRTFSRSLQLSIKLHGVTFHNMTLFIANAVRTLHLAKKV